MKGVMGALGGASPTLVGLAFGAGVLLVAAAIAARRPNFARRAAAGRPASMRAPGRGRGSSVFAALADSLGSTTPTVVRRLVLLGADPDPAPFRLRQALAGGAGMGCAVAFGAPFAWSRGASGLASLIVLGTLGALAGVALWDRLLTVRANARQRRIDAQVPDASELLALAVGAGESIPAALERVARISNSDLAHEIEVTVAEIRLGLPSTRALGELGARNDSAPLDRLCQTLITAIERGSPLARVLHDQAKDIREASRQRLLEEGGKREIAMLLPVVFLILPVTVLFALYPGLMALELMP